MAALRVTRIGPAVEPEDVGDDYIALSLRFQPEGSGLYCYVEQRGSGPNRGYIELKVRPDTGEIAAVVVLTVPANAGRFPEEVPVVAGSVCLDLSGWDELGDDPRVNFVRASAALTVSEKDCSVYYGLSEVRPEQFVVSGRAGFGVGPAGELTGIVTDPT